MKSQLYGANNRIAINLSYPDGCPYIPEKNLGDLDYDYVFRPDKKTGYADLLVALSILSGMKGKTYDKIYSLHITCLPGARQDHKTSANLLNTLKYVADRINELSLEVVTFLDVHSNVAEALINNSINTPIANANFRIPGRYDGIVAPDSGATKRAQELAEVLKIPVYQGWKKRDPATGKLSGFGVEPVPKNAKLLVVDDICDAGGTFIGLAEALSKQTKNIYLYVSHGYFTDPVKLKTLCSKYKGIFTTDSLIHNKEILSNKKITVIDTLNWYQKLDLPNNEK